MGKVIIFLILATIATVAFVIWNQNKVITSEDTPATYQIAPDYVIPPDTHINAPNAKM